MTEIEINQLEYNAYLHWIKFWRYSEIDQEFKTFQNLKRTELNLKNIREARSFTRERLAKRIGLTPSAISKLEISEKRGTITLKKLKKVAEGLECELIYGFKFREPISLTIWNQALTLARRTPFYRYIVYENPTDDRKHMKLGNRIGDLLEDPHIRRKLNWSQRSRVSSGGAFRNADREWGRWQTKNMK